MLEVRGTPKLLGRVLTLLGQGLLLGFLLMAAISTMAELGYAHGKEADSNSGNRREVNVLLHIGAVPQSIDISSQKSIQLIHAYLSTFSVQLIPCQKTKQIIEKEASTFGFGWFISSAYANHGVRFSKPTQIPVRTLVDIMQPADIDVGIFNIPSGRYCEMNYTMAHSGKRLEGSVVKELPRHSLYFSGRVLNIGDTRTGDNTQPFIQTAEEIYMRATYAFGKNVETLIDIPIYHGESIGKLQLDIFVDPGAALASVDFSQSEHKMARQFFLELPRHIRATLTTN